MKANPRMTTTLVLLTAFTTVVMAPVASIASTVGRRNTAIGLSAAAIYAAARGRGGAALALGAGAAYAWKRHNDARKHTYYYRGYRRGAQAGYYNYYRYGAGPGYNRGYHNGYYYGRRTHGYRRVYYTKHGRLHYYYVKR